MPLKRPEPMTDEEWLVYRFWQGVDVRGPDECWPWIKARVTDGYGTIALRAKEPVAAHRLAFRLSNGEIPEGLWVLHTCDNPPCCNPKHLVLGTSESNIADMISKKRGTVKLGPEEVAAIRADPRKQRFIADLYGVSQSQISLIKSGRRWKKGARLV